MKPITKSIIKHLLKVEFRTVAYKEEEIEWKDIEFRSRCHNKNNGLNALCSSFTIMSYYERTFFKLRLFLS